MRIALATTRIGQLLVLAFVAFAVLLFVGLGVGPRTSTYRTMTVLTGSMGETLPAGSVAVQTPIDVSDIKVGDIITYRIPVEDRRVVTHRIVQILERGSQPVVVTKGDGNNAPDAWTARLEAGGTWKTQFGVPRLGYVVQALRGRLAHGFTVLLIPFIIALLWLSDIWRGQRENSVASTTPSVVVPRPSWHGAKALVLLGAVLVADRALGGRHGA